MKPALPSTETVQAMVLAVNARSKCLPGNDGKLSKEEKSILTDSEIREGYRLACRFRPMNDVTVETSLEEGAVKRKTKLPGHPARFCG